MAVIEGGKVVAHAMRDEETFAVEMSFEEWNALPFHWFEDMGSAPRRTEKWQL